MKSFRLLVLAIAMSCLCLGGTKSFSSNTPLPNNCYFEFDEGEYDIDRTIPIKVRDLTGSVGVHVTRRSPDNSIEIHYIKCKLSGPLQEVSTFIFGWSNKYKQIVFVSCRQDIKEEYRCSCCLSHTYLYLPLNNNKILRWQAYSGRCRLFVAEYFVNLKTIPDINEDSIGGFYECNLSDDTIKKILKPYRIIKCKIQNHNHEIFQILFYNKRCFFGKHPYPLWR